MENAKFLQNEPHEKKSCRLTTKSAIVWGRCKQWRSQPDNLVPLCKFKLFSSYYHYSYIYMKTMFSQSMNMKIFA